jgi:hypothetical protein
MKMSIEVEQNGFRDLLRQRIGRHGVPLELVADATGITVRRIRSHLSLDGYRPNDRDIRAYIDFFGQDLLNEWMSPVGLGNAHRSRCLEGTAISVSFDILHSLHTKSLLIGDAVSDGNICDKERTDIQKRMLTFSAEATAYAHGLTSGALN